MPYRRRGISYGGDNDVPYPIRLAADATAGNGVAGELEEMSCQLDVVHAGRVRQLRPRRACVRCVGRRQGTRLEWASTMCACPSVVPIGRCFFSDLG